MFDNVVDDIFKNVYHTPCKASLRDNVDLIGATHHYLSEDLAEEVKQKSRHTLHNRYCLTLEQDFRF